jgi:hypothetical protein
MEWVLVVAASGAAFVMYEVMKGHLKPRRSVKMPLPDGADTARHLALSNIEQPVLDQSRQVLLDLQALLGETDYGAPGVLRLDHTSTGTEHVSLLLTDTSLGHLHGLAPSPLDLTSSCPGVAVANMPRLNVSRVPLTNPSLEVPDLSFSVQGTATTSRRASLSSLATDVDTLEADLAGGLHRDAKSPADLDSARQKRVSSDANRSSAAATSLVEPVKPDALPEVDPNRQKVWPL